MRNTQHPPDRPPPASDGDYLNRLLYNREGTEAGTVFNTSLCTLSGCRGTRLHVRWPDGRRTFPCAKGCTVRDDGHLQIL